MLRLTAAATRVLGGPQEKTVPLSNHSAERGVVPPAPTTPHPANKILDVSTCDVHADLARRTVRTERESVAVFCAQIDSWEWSGASCGVTTRGISSAR